MIQREGRILRQGNENEKVRIFRYITKASFDAYSWQLLEMKQRFISQIMSGQATMRDGTDIDDAVLNYAEVKALAVGNPKIKRRVEVSNELNKFRILHNDYCAEREKKRLEMLSIPAKISDWKTRIKNCKKDIAVYEANRGGYEALTYIQQKEIRDRIYTAVIDNRYSSVKVFILNYLGFDIFVPPNMLAAEIKPALASEPDETVKRLKEKHYVQIAGNNTYYLEIESSAGITKRLNNFLDRLGELRAEYEDRLSTLESRLVFLEKELANEEGGYMKEITSLSSELDSLNEELGVV